LFYPSIWCCRGLAAKLIPDTNRILKMIRSIVHKYLGIYEKTRA